MKDIVILLIHLLTTTAKLLGPGGAKAVVAENLLLKQQLLVVTRSRRRAPNLSTVDRFLMGFWSLFLRPARLAEVAVSIRPSTLLQFHQCLVRRKYRRLFSRKRGSKPGPKGPSEPLIRAIVELKRRNRRFGCPRIALIISKTFGIDKDSRWSVDLFRCESIRLKSHWVLVVMDQFTRRLIGFGVHAGDVDGTALCRMFSQIISGKKPPHYTKF